MDEVIELDINEVIIVLQAIYTLDYEGAGDISFTNLMRKLEEFVAENGREDLLRGYWCKSKILKVKFIFHNQLVKNKFLSTNIESSK